MSSQMEILSYTALELSREIREGRMTAVEAVEAVLERIREKEETVHAYVRVDETAALRRAEEVQREIEKGCLKGPLAGVPVAVKDNLCTRGMETTCCSRILEGFVPSYSAEAVRNLEKAGAVLIGKTNMDEFAMGSTTETSAYGATRNPWNPAYVPGGSSGGSAAAVAAGECFAALGSDTGGSVRQPAAFCGVVGMKPTYGTVSRYGLIAYASSMDQVGPITKDVRDCAAVLAVLASHDPKDTTSLKREDLDFSDAFLRGVEGLRIGVLSDYFGEGLHPEVKRAVLGGAELLKSEGALVETFELGLTEFAVPAYYMIASAEASSNLERFDGVKYGYRTKEAARLDELYRKTRSEGFGEEVKRRILLGTFALSAGYYDAYYLKALKVRAMIKQRFEEVFRKYDAILGPVAPTTAPELGGSLQDPLKMYLGDIYTIAANLSGLPAISIPCGMDSRGLPIGMQLMGDCFQEKKLFRIAYTYEQCRRRQNSMTQTPEKDFHRTLKGAW